MKLDLSKVFDAEGEVVVVAADVDLRWVKYRGLSPFNELIACEAKACNRAGIVTLSCSYRYTLSLSCDRCLTPYTDEISKTFEHTVVRSLNSSDEDDEYVVAPDGIVELNALATNDIIPELPSKFLCKEDCKGLCPVCGCNLNTNECDCKTEEPDSPFAALDKFFD